MTDDTRDERDAPTLSPFAQEMHDTAEKALSTLNERRTEVEGAISELQEQLQSLSREAAEAQLVLDALDGKLVRTDDATRFEPSSSAERTDRPRWGTPLQEITDDMRVRADKFLSTHEGNFTFGELGSILTPDDKPMVEPHVVDALLSELLTANDIMVDHEASEASIVRYIAVVPPPTPGLESARSEDGGVQPKSDEAPADSEEGATSDVPVTPEEIEEQRAADAEREPDEQPDDETGAAPVLPSASGADRQKAIDDAVLEHLAEHPRSRRADIMSALSLTDIAAAQSLSRLVKGGEAKVVAEDPARWSLADAEAPKPEAAEAATTERQSRRGGSYLTLEIVRDAAKNIGERFNARTLAEWMTANLDIGDVHSASPRRYIRELEDKGILIRHGGKSGPGVKYEYVKPNGGGPTSRPRHDHPRQLPKGTAEQPERGEAVAHTGRAKGRAGKSGENKKKQALGFRVRTARGDRKRAG